MATTEVTMPTALDRILGYDEDTGAYERSFMLRRLAQMAVAQDRGIGLRALGRATGYSYEQIRLYFQGSAPGRAHNEGRLGYLKRVRRFEDDIERALEGLSREKGISMPLVLGTEEEHYIAHEVIARDLMAAPPGYNVFGRRHVASKAAPLSDPSGRLS